MRHSHQEDQRAQYIGVAQPGITYVLLFCLAVFLQHVLHFVCNRLLPHASAGRFVVEPRINQSFIAPGHRSQSGDQGAVMQCRVCPSGFGESERESQQQMLLLVDELVSYLYL